MEDLEIIVDLDYRPSDYDFFKLNGIEGEWENFRNSSCTVGAYRKMYPKIIIARKRIKPRFESNRPFPWGY